MHCYILLFIRAMSQRRQLLGHDHRNFRDQSFRKKRTYNAAPAYFKPSVYRAQAYAPESATRLDSVQLSWIGKKIIYHGQEGDLAHWPGNRLVDFHGMIPEYVIARYAIPNSYRIIYTSDLDKEINQLSTLKYSNTALDATSIYTYEYRPGRMNIIIDPQTDIIRDIQYF